MAAAQDAREVTGGGARGGEDDRLRRIARKDAVESLRLGVGRGGLARGAGHEGAQRDRVGEIRGRPLVRQEREQGELHVTSTGRP